jgi:hypothetical protein
MCEKRNVTFLGPINALYDAEIHLERESGGYRPSYCSDPAIGRHVKMDAVGLSAARHQ